MARTRTTRPHPARPSTGALEPLEPRTLLSVQLVADLNATPGSSDPANAVQVNGVTIFIADDNVHGREVWRTDGTPEGTSLIRDVTIGPETSNPVILGTAGGLAYFKAGSSVWQTDGTSQNTYSLMGSSVGSTAEPGLIATMGDTLYVSDVYRLYRLRPYAVSEVQVSPTFSWIKRIASTGSKLIVLTENKTLWSVDANTLRSQAIAQIDYAEQTAELVSMGDAVYFTRRNSTTSKYELWKTQGTAATTTLIAPVPAAATSMTVVGQTLYFWAGKSFIDGSAALWKSDGTAQGTVEVKKVPLPRLFSEPFPALTASGGKVFFADSTITSVSAPPKLWVSDGTSAGTVVASTAVSPRPSSYPFDRRVLFDFNGTLLFQGSDATAGSELWKTDGSAAGTFRIADLIPGADGSAPQMLATIGSRALFSAATPDSGRELWITDGTPEGTSLFKDLNTGTDGSAINDPVSVNGKLVLTVAGLLHVLPDSGSAPQPLSFADPSIQATNCRNLKRVGNLVYFQCVIRGRTGTHLCVTDGTAQGTRIVKTLTNAYDPANFTAVGDRLFFTDGTYGNSSVYTSDGTEAGTVALAGGFAFISAGPTPNPYYVAAGNRFYFSAQIGSGGPHELWTSDGTPEGTTRVISFASTTSWVGQLTPANGRLYFVGTDSKLYQTDGTPAGTSVVGTGAYAPRGTAPDDSLLLVATNVLGSPKLLRLGATDTTPTPLADVAPGYNAPSARAGRWLYFVGNGRLWRTDGTPQGTTVVVSNVFSDPADLTAAGDLLYYTDERPGLGRELWATDGTPGGEYLVADMVPGWGGPTPADLVAVGDTLYFTALDGVHGRELWRAVNGDDVAPSATSSYFDYGARPSVTVTFTENPALDTLTLDDWKLVNRATGQDVSDRLTSLTYDGNTYTATLRLADSLPNGDYRLLLPTGAAADRAGNPTASDVTLDFWHLPGDMNRDRRVNFSDLARLAQNYNKSFVGYTNGDLNGDGVVNFSDLAILAQNYNISLPSPPAAATLSAPLSAAVAPARRKTPAVFNVTAPIAKRLPAPPKPLTPVRIRP